QRLPRVRAHVLVVLGDHDAGVVGERPGDRRAVHGSADVLPAVTHEDTDAGHQRTSPAAWARAATAAAGTEWRCSPSDREGRPSASPTSSVRYSTGSGA